jgi:16S rRNA C1402 N4-methylase RsmH
MLAPKPLDIGVSKEHYSQADRGGTPFEQDSRLSLRMSDPSTLGFPA